MLTRRTCFMNLSTYFKERNAIKPITEAIVKRTMESTMLHTFSSTHHSQIIFHGNRLHWISIEPFIQLNFLLSQFFYKKWSKQTNFMKKHTCVDINLLHPFNKAARSHSFLPLLYRNERKKSTRNACKKAKATKQNENNSREKEKSIFVKCADLSADRDSAI